MGTLLAVDGNSLGHRAFHARARDGAEGPHVTGTVVGMLATAWAEGPYDAVLVAFDAEQNRRKEVHAGYKANRPAPPPGLDEQLTWLRTHLASCGFTVAGHPGAEADDVLAAAADSCVGRGWHCDLLSSDRDLTALVGPTTRLLRPRASMADLVIEDEARVRRVHGVEPRQYTDLAALRGDPSDGLDGVHGIGPKTAARLLREHGSVPGIYAALHELHPRVEAALRAGRERVERNLLLMAPLPNLDVDVDGAVMAGVDPQRVDGALTPLGLGHAARRFARALEAPPRPPAPPDEPVGTGFLVAAVAARARPPVTAPHVGEQAALF